MGYFMTIDEARQKIIKIRNDLNELNIQNSSCQDIYYLYREYLQVVVQIRRQIPKYDNGIWRYNNNCYFYALDLPTPTAFIETARRLYLNFSTKVGDISGIRTIQEEMNIDKFNKYLAIDLEYLGIETYKSAINLSPKHNGYKIAIFLDEEYFDYHFVRQNEDGIWSQKMGYGDTIVLSYNPLDFINANCLYHNYKYVNTIEVVKPTLRRVK